MEFVSPPLLLPHSQSCKPLFKCSSGQTLHHSFSRHIRGNKTKEAFVAFVLCYCTIPSLDTLAQTIMVSEAKSGQLTQKLSFQAVTPEMKKQGNESYAIWKFPCSKWWECNCLAVFFFPLNRNLISAKTKGSPAGHTNHLGKALTLPTQNQNKAIYYY